MMSNSKMEFTVVNPRFLKSSYVLALFYIIFISTPLYCIADRQLHFLSQLGCNMSDSGEGYNGSFPNVAYIRADGVNDSLHYIITNVGLPTVFVAKTAVNAPHATIDCENLLVGNVSGSLYFNAPVAYSFGVVFTKLYEFNDTDKKADMTYYDPYNKTVWKIHDFSRFDWYKMETTNQSDAIVIYAKSEDADDGDDINKTISFSFLVRDQSDRYKMMPHLLYNENITQIELLINDYKPNFVKSRFGMEMALFSGGTDELPVELDVARTLDDEHTPGVFQMDNWLTRVPEAPRQGFLQWKPVLYAKPDRARNDGRKVVTYDILHIADDDFDVRSLFNQTLLYAFYQDDLYSNLSMQMLNVSFGLSDDGGYVKTNYTVWTLNLGYGTPPSDEVTVVVIIVISCGLGLPVVFILVGGTIVFVKKHRRKKSLTSGTNTSFPAVR